MPRIKDRSSLAFVGASVATARLAVTFSSVACVSKKMPLPAAAATTTDARQRREVNGSRYLPARPDLSRDALVIPGGSGRGCWFVVSSRPREVLSPTPNAIVQSKCWAARTIMLEGANPGLALRCGGISGIINPYTSNIPASGLRFACSPRRQSQPDGTHSAPTHWLRERRRGSRSVRLLRRIGGIKPPSQSGHPNAQLTFAHSSKKQLAPKANHGAYCWLRLFGGIGRDDIPAMIGAARQESAFSLELACPARPMRCGAASSAGLHLLLEYRARRTTVG
jgi:hypothetical protein